MITYFRGKKLRSQPLSTDNCDIKQKNLKLTLIGKIKVYRVTIQVVPQPRVDIKMNDPFQYMSLILKYNYCFDVNRRFRTT